MTSTGKTLYILFLSLIASPAWAQAEEGWLVSGGVGNFFICVIAGILLAFAFHFLLTNLAVAIGITAMGDVRDMRQRNSTSVGAMESTAPGSTGVKISSAMGVYLTLTMAISLFFASLIAVKLSLIPSNSVGLTLGLVIWAGYLLIGLYLDSKLMATMVGSFFSLAKSALSTGASALSGAGGVLAPSRKEQVHDIVQDTVRTIHEEVRQEFDLSGMEKKLDEYVEKLEPRKLDVQGLEEHIKDLLREIEIKEEATPEDPEATRRIFLEFAGKHKLSEHDKQRLSQAFDRAREGLKTEGSRMDKAKAAMDSLSPGGGEQAREYRRKVEEYLRGTGREELDPAALERDLERMLDDPRAAPEVLRQRLAQIDRDTLKAALTAREGIDDAKAERYLGIAEQVLQRIRTRAGQRHEGANEGTGSLGAGANAQATGAAMQGDTGRHGLARVEEAVARWFDRMNQPELEYERLKWDARRMLDDPKAAPGILKSRLRHMDHDSLVALISNNPRISREQAEKAVSKIEEARDEVILKTEQIELRVRQKVDEVEREALKKAEGARKTTAAAAWWLFVASIVSALASAFGGVLAISV